MSPKDTFGNSNTSQLSGVYQKPIIGLALQGAAAHGAYTWGVLDRLLEEEGIQIGAISASSSGAFNAALLAHGLVNNDRQLAKDTLKKGWMMLSQAAEDLPKSLGAPASPFRSLEIPIWTMAGLSKINFDKAVGTWPNLSNWMHQLFLGSYSEIPEGVYKIPGSNPIYDILKELVDFEAIQKSTDLQVFVNSINGRTLKHTVHTGTAFTAEAVAASANLRYMMAPVYIDGDEHWDGGYMYNTYPDPLANKTSRVTDIKIVMANPIDQVEKPTNAARAEQRLNALLFSAAGLENLGKIAVLDEELEILRKAGASEKVIARLGKRIIHIHRTQFYPPLKYGTSSKYNLDPDNLMDLHDIGYPDEDRWLEQHKSDLGKRSTFDAKDFARADYRGTQATVPTRAPV